jgi:hypothetical protein
MKRFAAVLTVVLFYPLNSAPAAPSRQSASEIPVLDIRPVCRGIASQSSDPGVGQGGQAQTFQQCVESERAVLEQIKQEWGTFAAEDKRHCVALATTGGESSNTELLTCLEMARDVRLLRSAATAAPSRGETTKSESSASSRAAPPSSAMSAPQLAPPPSPRAPAAERPSEVGANTSKERADGKLLTHRRRRCGANLSRRKQRCSWRRRRPGVRPRKPIGQKPTPRLQGIQRRRRSVNLPTRKQHEQQPKRLVRAAPSLGLLND